MKCSVRAVNGITIPIEFDENTTVLEVKKMVQNIQGTPFYTFMLVFGGKVLKDNLFLKDYGIQVNSTIQCIENTSGGWF